METFSKHNYNWFLLIGFLTFLYIDFFSKSSIGIFLSILLFIFFIILSCVNLSKGILFSLLYAILVIEFPRDILDVYSQLQIENTIQYNVLNTVKIGPLTLFVYLMLFNTILVLLKTIRLKFNATNAVLILSFLFIGLSSMSRIFFLEGALFYPKLIITDIKFPIFLFLGLIQGAYIFKHKKFNFLIDLLLLTPIIIGFRAILFILHDSITGTSNLDLMTQPYLSLAVLVVLILKGNWGPYKKPLLRILLFLSLLNPSRGFFVLAAIFIITALIWKFHKKFQFNFLFILQIIFVTTLIFGGIFIFNERMYKFFMWKFNVFQEFFNSDIEISGSGKVRYLELANVVKLLSTSLYELCFGRGFAGTYDFSNYPINNVGVIDLKSFSQDQLKSGVFYTAHSFFTTILLKYGIIGIFIYLFIPLRIFVFFITKKKYLFICIFSILLIYLYYSRIEYMLLIGVFLGALQLKKEYV